MTDTADRTESASSGTGTAPAARRRSGSLSSMLLPELQQLAGSLGISTAKKKKSDLVGAIEAHRAGNAGASTAPSAPAATSASAAPTRNGRGAATRADDSGPANSTPPVDSAASRAHGDGSADTAAANVNGASTRARAPRRAATRPTAAATTIDAGATGADVAAAPVESPDAGPSDGGAGRESGRERRDQRQNTAGQNRADRSDRQGGGQQQGGQNNQNSSNQNHGGAGGQQHNGQGGNQQNRNDRNDQNRSNRNDQNRNDRNDQGGYDDDENGGRRRGRRYRDRNRNRNRDRQDGGFGGNDSEPTVSDDDVLVPIAGIVDAQEEKNTWFIRVSGYFSSPDDIYVQNSFVRRFGLRRGDAVTGAVRQPRDGERREKYNPLVRLDTVNGQPPNENTKRPEFTKLTPLYPQQRLRLETESHILTTRVIDLVMPIGKGQRALIVSPPKAGKTMVLQAIANAITVNNPECHLMVVLVDERPEEVTDMQRSVKGEVIASTFDRRPQDHTMVAELSIERAKRLVEMGHDVVVLLDSITRLGRAYNLAAPASGRILSGGVDSAALYPPKRFLGAARNIENGGSLTIIATALVETGSAGDTVIFEEYKGTGNAELKLDRKIADKRVFPAVDVDQSSTRKEELLLAPDEFSVVMKLRRVLHALESQQAIDLLTDRLKKSRNNYEFLMQIAKTAPGGD